MPGSLRARSTTSHASAASAARDHSAVIKFPALLLHRLTPWLIALAGTIASVTGWLHTGSRVAFESEVRFANLAEAIKGDVTQRAQRYLDLLRVAQAYFAASDEVTRQDFHDYAERLDLRVNYPGVQAFQFARYVHHADKRTFEAAVRADRSVAPEAYAAYAIHPPGDRPAYVAVEFNQPMRGNEAALGHDQIFEAKRREVMERARDTGLPAASAPIALVQDGASTPAVVVRMPLYRQGAPRDTVEERRAGYLGQLTLVVRIADLMSGLLPEHALDRTQVRIADTGLVHVAMPLADDAEGEPLFDTHSKAGAVAARWNEATLSKSLSLDFGGRVWRMTFERHEGVALLTTGPLAVLVGGAGITLLLFAMARTLATRHARAVRMAEHMTLQLRDSEARYRSLVDSIQEVVFQVDAKGCWTFLNPAWEAVMGFPTSESLGRSFLEFVHPEDRAACVASFEPILRREKNACRNTSRYLTRDGAERWIDVNAQPVFDVAGEIVGTAGTLTDVTQRVIAEADMRRLAHHDKLTGLPNRALFEDRARMAIEGARRRNKSVAFLFVDLDRFKPINDTHGHHVGDLVLKEIGTRLLSCVRTADTVARLGGDEFVVLLNDVDHPAGTIRVADRINAKLARPIMYGDHALSVSASIGISAFPEDGEEVAALMQLADAQLYAVKHAGRDGYRLASSAAPVHPAPADKAPDSKPPHVLH
jgi:diguanylate cyclase (GGDEF)-like protein/PAS domain S-box-containing protein